jgi:hypothetical protein
MGVAKRALLYCGNHQISWGEVTWFMFMRDNNAAFLVVYLELKSWIANHTILIWHKRTNGEPRYNFQKL